jgi:hypothetical protein
MDFNINREAILEKIRQRQEFSLHECGIEPSRIQAFLKRVEYGLSYQKRYRIFHSIYLDGLNLDDLVIINNTPVLEFLKSKGFQVQKGTTRDEERETFTDILP